MSAEPKRVEALAAVITARYPSFDALSASGIAEAVRTAGWVSPEEAAAREAAARREALLEAEAWREQANKTKAAFEAERPVAKYRYTLVITGNTHAEIADRLHSVEMNHWLDVTELFDGERRERDEFEIHGRSSRETRILEHTNPDMTPERYDAELAAWWAARKATKRDRVAEADELRKQVRG